MGKKEHQAKIVELFEEASPELHRVLYRKLGNHHEVEEVAQNAFLKLCDKADSDEIDDLRRYFFTMANRMALNVLRRRRVENDYFSSQYRLMGAELDSANPENVASSYEKLESIKKALHELPRKTRQIFLMHRFEGYSYPEIAKQVGLSAKSVEYHMCKAIAAIIECTRGEVL